MSIVLPTAKELEKLSARAVVAYAARIARRLSPGLRGIVADDLVEDALRLVDTVWTCDVIGDANASAIIFSAARIVAAFASAPAAARTRDNFCVVCSLNHAALAAMSAILAAGDPENARHNLIGAAIEADRAAREAIALDRRNSTAAADAARQDYEVLLREYGEHHDVVIGEPVVCFAEREEKGERR